MVDLLFRRYMWLIETIREAGEISYSDIAAKWARSSQNDNRSQLTLRTFHNHCNAIERHFGIEIACHRGRGRNTYYITEPDSLESNVLIRWVLNSLSISSLLAGYQDVADRILLEEASHGAEYLAPILKGLRENKRLCLSYCSFRNALYTGIIVDPLCVKMFKRRWYLLCRLVDRNDFRIFALDRIRELDYTEDSFTYPNGFQPNDYFSNYYGISTDGYSRPTTVRLRAYYELPNYLRSLPLHTSQREVATDEKCAIFEYFLIPAFDFVQEILLHGDQIEVLAPLELRDRVAWIVRSMNGLYRKTE